MNLKQIAGEKAVDFIEDGMVVGLGTGSTVYYTLRKIGERVREGLKIKGICTSEQTRQLAEQWAIPYIDINEVEHIDLTIDGADEVDAHGNGIKGGGGSLMYEKIVASGSSQNIWVVESRKMVHQLGSFPLPVEILPFGYQHTLKSLSRKSFKPELRKAGNVIFLTDGDHYIADLHLGIIEDPYELDAQLKKIPGVLEHGLFLEMVHKVVISDKDGVIIKHFR